MLGNYVVDFQVFCINHILKIEKKPAEEASNGQKFTVVEGRMIKVLQLRGLEFRGSRRE